MSVTFYPSQIKQDLSVTRISYFDAAAQDI